MSPLRAWMVDHTSGSARALPFNRRLDLSPHDQRVGPEVVIMQQPTQPGRPISAESFPTDPVGLPEATRPELLELADGDTFDLRIGAVAKRLGAVAKRLGDTTVRMLGYNGSIPGPAAAPSGSPTAAHWTSVW
jgi:hypothetical protein